MLKLIRVLMVSLLLLTSQTCTAAVFPNNTTYQTCFTPGEDCTSLITNTINQAKSTIYVQAYSFTSAPIAKAIVDAKNRGIKVIVILDKSQAKDNRYSSAKYLLNQQVPVWIDHKPAIAHNKVIIIDNTTVITGSFNFTKAAQTKNAENVLLINSRDLAQTYLKNLQKRQAASKFLEAQPAR